MVTALLNCLRILLGRVRYWEAAVQRNILVQKAGLGRARHSTRTAETGHSLHLQQPDWHHSTADMVQLKFSTLLALTDIEGRLE